MLPFTLWFIKNTRSTIFYISLLVFLLVPLFCVWIFHLLYFASSCNSHFSLITLARILLTGTDGEGWGDDRVTSEGLAISLYALWEISRPNCWLTAVSFECGIHNISYFSALGPSKQFQGNSQHPSRFCHKYIIVFKFPQIHFSVGETELGKFKQLVKNHTNSVDLIVVDFGVRLKPDWL